jgi:hypothetical protein
VPGLGRRAVILTGSGAELGQLGAVGVGLAFGTLSACPQVAADGGKLGGSLRAEPGERLLRISAYPLRLGAGGIGGCLRAGRLLLRSVISGVQGVKSQPEPRY